MKGKGNLYVYGAGGHGKVVADAAQSAGWAIVGYVDDAPERAGTNIWGLPVRSMGEVRKHLPAHETPLFALGIGDNAARERCYHALRAEGLAVATVIHRSATVAATACVGEGTVILANAVVNPDASIGPGCIVNSGAIVEHDCALGSFVHLSPGAALGGGVSVGDHSHLGLGAVVLPSVVIGTDVTIGAGAVVLRSTGPGETLVGMPARPLERARKA